MRRLRMLSPGSSILDIMNDAVEDGVGERRITDDVVHLSQGAGKPAFADTARPRDIRPKNIRLKLSFTIHITLAPENASSRSDESFTEVAFILRLSRRMVAAFYCRRG